MFRGSDWRGVIQSLDEIVKRVTDDVVALHQLYATVRNAFGEYVFGFSPAHMTIAQVIGV